jgi:hypothetical protein
MPNGWRALCGATLAAIAVVMTARPCLAERWQQID